MKLAPYNLHEAIEMLKARAFLVLMTEPIHLDQGHPEDLWEIVGGMTEDEAHEAIAAFEATQ